MLVTNRWLGDVSRRISLAPTCFSSDRVTPQWKQTDRIYHTLCRTLLSYFMCACTLRALGDMLLYQHMSDSTWACFQSLYFLTRGWNTCLWDHVLWDVAPDRSSMIRMSEANFFQRSSVKYFPFVINNLPVIFWNISLSSGGIPSVL